MNHWIKRIVATGLALGALFVGLLLMLSGIGHARGVRAVVPQAPSLISSRIADANYVDAYRITVAPGRFRDLDDVVAVAFQKGRQVDRNATEVVYEDRAPGRVFYVAYQLASEGGQSTLTRTTVVRYIRSCLASSERRAYFAVVRQVHQRVMPFMLSRMVRSADNRRP